MTNTATPTSTVQVYIPVSTFNNVDTGQFCTIGNMQIFPLNPSETRVAITNGALVITESVEDTSQLDLQFFVLDTNQMPAAGAPFSGTPNYNVLGIAFAGSDSGAFAPAGGSGGSLTFQDAIGNDLGNGEFVMIAQQTSTSNIGIIDPPIDNDN
jgi:hypothetical protein